MADIFAGRGYSSDDIDGIFHGNWLRFFTEALPQSSERPPSEQVMT